MDLPIDPGNPGVKVEIEYTNYRGDRGSRVIVPIRLYYGNTPYHPEFQWMLTGMDLAKEAERDFAMKDIHSWKPVVS